MGSESVRERRCARTCRQAGHTIPLYVSVVHLSGRQIAVRIERLRKFLVAVFIFEDESNFAPMILLVNIDSMDDPCRNVKRMADGDDKDLLKQNTTNLGHPSLVLKICGFIQ